MSTKHDSPCLLKAGDKEPIFVLRAQDKTADVCLEAWIEINTRSLGTTHPKILAAKKTQQDFMNWKKRKYPD